MPPRKIFIIYFFFFFASTNLLSQSSPCPGGVIEIMGYADQNLLNQCNGDVTCVQGIVNRTIGGAATLLAQFDMTVVVSGISILGNTSTSSSVDNLAMFSGVVTNDCRTQSVEMAVLVTGANQDADGISNFKNIWAPKIPFTNRAVAVIESSPNADITMAHEILHNLGFLQHSTCNSQNGTPRCGTNLHPECEPISGQVPLLCCDDCGEQIIKLLSDVKDALEGLLEEQCNLFQDAEIFPSSCNNCAISLSMTNDAPPILGYDCNGSISTTQVIYEIEICNNCTSDKALNVRFESPNLFQTVIDPEPEFKLASSIGNYDNYTLVDNQFLADEFRTYKIKTHVDNQKVTSPNPDQTIVKLTASDNILLSDANSFSNNFPITGSVISITGTARLSDFVHKKPWSNINGIGCNSSIENVLIDGKFIIDLPYCFDGTNFLFSQGSSMEIARHRSIRYLGKTTFRNCNMLPCSRDMWKEIKVEDQISLVLDDCLIRGAETGLKCLGTTTLSLFDVKFTNNNVGIFNENGLIDFTKFNLVHFSAGNLLNGERGFAGVSLKNCLGTTILNSQSNFISSYSNMRNGIYAENSSIEASNARFLNMTEVYDDEGNGIYVKGGNRTLGATIRNNIFGSNGTGIRLEKTSAIIEENSFINDKRGIHSKDKGFLRIRNNNIDSKENGVYSNDDRQVIIQNNNLIRVIGEPSKAANAYAVRVESPSNTLAAIVNNKNIQGVNAEQGVSMQGGSFLVAARNKITVASEKGAGIKTKAVKQIALNCNSVIGSGNQSQGILNIDSGGQIECNKTTGSNNGVEFRGGMTDVAFKGNAMLGNPGNGLALTGDNISIGKQYHHGNVWQETSASHQGQFVNSSEFFTHKIDDGFFPNPPDPDFWFKIRETDSWFICPDPTCGINIPELPDFPDVPDFPEPEECEEITETDKRVAAGIFNNAREGNLWNAQKRLLEKIKIPCTEVPPEFPEINIFEEEHNNSELSKLVDVEMSIQNLWKRTEEETNAWETVQTNMGIALDSWKALGEQLQDSTLTEDEIETLNIQRVNAFEVIEQLQEQIDNLTIDFEQTIQDGILMLESENNVIETTSTPAENDRLVNAIYLTKWKSDSENIFVDNLITLFDIASQCPQDGGDAVYKARALYAQFYPETLFEDTDCEGVEFRRKSNSIKTLTTNFVLKPNPAKNEVQIQFLNSSEFPGTIRLVSVLGKNIAEFDNPKTNNQLTLDLTTLNSGIYFVQIWKNDSLINSQKLSIIK